MNKSSHIIFAYNFDSEGNATSLKSEDVAQELKNDGLSWVHLDVGSKLTKDWLRQEVSYLDHLIIDALLAEQTRPRITKFSNGMLMILRGVNSGKKSQPEDMISVRIWIDDQRIITLQRRPLKAVNDLSQEILEGKKIKASSEFLYNIIYKILSDISPFVYGLNERVDALENKVIATHNIAFREEVLSLRTESTIFKSYLVPQRKAINLLCDIDISWVDAWAKRHFHENLDQVSHLVEECEEALNRSHILHQELNNALSERLNKSIYKLSLITVIFMPLTFITGFFGMNIGGIPGSNNPSAFVIAVFATAIIALLLFLFVRNNDRFK